MITTSPHNRFPVAGVILAATGIALMAFAWGAQYVVVVAGGILILCGLQLMNKG